LAGEEKRKFLKKNKWRGGPGKAKKREHLAEKLRRLPEQGSVEGPRPTTLLEIKKEGEDLPQCGKKKRGALVGKGRGYRGDLLGEKRLRHLLVLFPPQKGGRGGRRAIEWGGGEKGSLRQRWEREKHPRHLLA